MANVNIFDKASLQGILCRAFQAEFEALVEKELEPAIAEFENKVNLIIQRAKKKSAGEAAKAAVTLLQEQNLALFDLRFGFSKES